jgi:Domain of unknown function (DUF4062)
MDKRYQVFVSSTYADLKNERRAVIQALMEMDCIPAGMELFPAADEEQFQFITKIIDDCDYYILIVGGRYGSVTSEGISYTEKEYDYARKIGLKVLAFIHEKPEELAAKNFELDKTLRDRLNAFREKAKTDTLVKMWTDATQLPGLVALSLSKTIKTYPAIGWVRANQLASAQALSDLNELRKLNGELLSRNGELEQRLADQTPMLNDLAGLDDLQEITGSHEIHGYGRSKWKFTMKWGEIFAAIAPYILENPNDTLMQSYFRSSILEAYKAQHPTSYMNWTVGDQNYQTVKVQLMALNLVEVKMATTSTGGMALFWFLTPHGRTTLLQLRTIKKNVEE